MNLDKFARNWQRCTAAALGYAQIPPYLSAIASTSLHTLCFILPVELGSQMFLFEMLTFQSFFLIAKRRGEQFVTECQMCVTLLGSTRASYQMYSCFSIILHGSFHRCWEHRVAWLWLSLKLWAACKSLRLGEEKGSFLCACLNISRHLLWTCWCAFFVPMLWLHERVSGGLVFVIFYCDTCV